MKKGLFSNSFLQYTVLLLHLFRLSYMDRIRS